MKPKLIIVIVLGLAGLGLGAMNWVNYLKNRPGAAKPEIASPSRKSNSPSKAPPASSGNTEEKQAEGVAGPKGFKLDAAPGNAAQAGSVSGGTASQLTDKTVYWPDSIGRNPFLSEQEIQQLARGEVIEDEPQQQLPANVGVMLPDVSISGMIIDSRTGNYRAIIDGKVHSVGDRVGVETITAITQRTVELEYSGRSRVITLAGVSRPDTGSTNENEIIMKELP